MKVLYLVDKYPTHSQPKYGKYPAILKMIRKEGWDVDMIAFLAQKTQSVWSWKKSDVMMEKYEGNRSVILKDYSYDNLIRILNYFLGRGVNFMGLNVYLGKFLHKFLERKLIRFIEIQGRPDVIHLYGVQVRADFIGAKLATNLATRFNIPLVLNLHEAIGYSYTRYNVPAPVIECFRTTSFFAPVSDPLGKYWKSIIPEIRDLPMQAIPNPVSGKVFRANSKSAKEHFFKIIHISKLDTNKNIEVIIEAFKRFLLKRPQAELLLIGNNILTDAANTAWGIDGKTNNIKLLGKKSREEISDIMANAHVYVQASTLETFGIPLVEAMMSGLPVIATSSGGPESFINKSNGKILRHPDSELIFRGFESIYKDYENYHPEAIRSYALESFSEESVSKQLIKTYTSIMTEV